MSDPLIAWHRLRAGNDRTTSPTRLVPRSSLRSDGRPTAAVFRCADSGLASEAVFGVDSLVETSTWGHAVDAGVMSTLEYAVEILEVPLIVVLGHHDCPAMRSALRAWNDAALPEGSTRITIEQVFGSIVRRGARADSVEDLAAAHLVDTGLSLLQRSPAIGRRIDTRRCGIVCATTNPADGRIRTLATVGAVGEPTEALLECV